METLLTPVMLSRIQFAATAMFHIIWPVLTIGLSIFLLVMEILWLKTREDVYFRHFQFWSRLFLLNFTVGAVTGIPMEFQESPWNFSSEPTGAAFPWREATFWGICSGLRAPWLSCWKQLS